MLPHHSVAQYGTAYHIAQFGFNRSSGSHFTAVRGGEGWTDGGDRVLYKMVGGFVSARGVKTTLSLF